MLNALVQERNGLLHNFGEMFEQEIEISEDEETQLLEMIVESYPGKN